MGLTLEVSLQPYPSQGYTALYLDVFEKGVGHPLWMYGARLMPNDPAQTAANLQKAAEWLLDKLATPDIP